jgi:hypothetical protein
MDLVISHYNENLDWINYIDSKFKIYVYSKTLATNELINNKIYIVNQPLNKGNEASAYLQYIIDNYENLSENIVFVHGHEKSWHHMDSIINIINSLQITDYANLNKYGTQSIFENAVQSSWLNTVDDFMDSANIAFENPPFILSLDYNSCAQFIVSRKNILSRSKEFYIRGLKYIIETHKSNKHNGGVFEYYWRWIFLHNDAISLKYKDINNANYHNFITKISI